MAVAKIDPKVIFASEAPAQDTPAVFTNKTVGWGESRKNGGRPTIKQSNALQQETDLKILWLNENSVTPFDATIDYPENAVTIKDGAFKILKSGVWELFLNKSSVGLSNVDNTSDLNKPVSTATQTALSLKADKSATYTKVEVDNAIDLLKPPYLASDVTDGNQTQDQINLYGAKTYDMPAGGYPVGGLVRLGNGDIVKSTINGNTNDPNVNMTGWIKENSASQIFDASGLSQQEINNNGFVLIDSRKLGLVGGIEDDQASAVAACNNYVNAIPIHKDTPIVLRLPKGLVRSSVGFAFDRQAILLANEDFLFDYTGNGYAVRLGKLGEVDSTGEYRTFGIKGVSLTGGDNCEHGVYIAQYVLSPVLDNVKLVDFGNPNNSNSFCFFFQGHNWDIYIRNSKGDWTTKNKVNLIRVNGVLTDGTPDYGNSRLNILDSFYNQGFNASAGIGVYINSFKSRFIGGGFQGFKTSVQFGEYAQTVEINGTYFETIYQDCESVFKIGEDGYTSEKTFSDLSLLNIYANLHNENNEFGNTNVKFLTTANNVKLSNLKIDNIKTLNGSKHPLLNLQEVSGQTCDVGNVSHSNALLHNIRDDQMVVMNSSKNYIRNSDFRVWQRGNSFTFNNGKKHLADGYTLLSDGTTGVLKVYDEPLLDAYNFNANAHGMMRLVRESATNATYNTLRIRVGELEDLAGQFATFSFAAKSDTPLNITATFVQDYGNGNVFYTSIGSLSVVQESTARNYAKSFFVPNINRATAKTAAARTYIDISLPLNTYVLDITCITLESGYVRKGWLSNSYSEELDFAKQYYQFGNYQSIQDQTRVQLNLRPVMRYSPTSIVHVTYQDAVVDYNANINVSDPDRIVYTLNARSQDVSVSWTADAEL